MLDQAGVKGDASLVVSAGRITQPELSFPGIVVVNVVCMHVENELVARAGVLLVRRGQILSFVGGDLE
ncbi:MAG: hypothetical protein CMJ75_14935 [Planctomycetaceae bacterium]|nr:hypothetical protein [Planctomycetaceae bacterium]